MYSVDNRWRNGHVVEGEWVLLKGRDQLGMTFYDPVLAERVAAALNILTDEQRRQVNDKTYRRAVLGEKAA